MTRFLTATLLLFSLLWVASAQAAIDCAKQTFAGGESARDYLERYGEECVAAGVAAQWKKWGITAADSTQVEDYSSMVPAWHTLADAFDQLAQMAPIGTMKDVYRELSSRARATGASLKTGMEKRQFPDVALFRRDAWEQVRMNLPEYKNEGDPSFRDLDIGSAMDEDCKEPASSLCTTTLTQGKQTMLYWKLADKLAFTVSSATSDELARQVAAKDALWNGYLYDSKPMLPFDLALTDLFERQWSKSDQYPEGFREPPVRQWFFLHPSVAMEYVSAAEDGQQLKPILIVELIGVNYWDNRRRPINVPVLRMFSGASLIVSYADRAGLKDTGVGALFTFDNVYSIGVTRYDSETGVSISLDLANLYREKYKPKYEAWKRSAHSAQAGSHL